MPPAFGTDRVEDLGEGRWAVDALRGKGWKARRHGSATSPAAPGTLVRWEGAYFEVVELEEKGSGARYVLAPWDEQNVFRTVEDYSEASERARREERKAEERRNEGRRVTVLLGLLVGHLPGWLQERLERELGTPATRLTVLSVFPPLLFGFFCVFAILADTFGRMHGAGPAFGIPIWLLPVGNYLFAESCVRLSIGLAQGRPIGSLAGYVAWKLGRWVWPGRIPAEPRIPADSGRSLVGVTLAPADEEVLRDALRMREPYLSLLSAADQTALARRFGWDPARWGRRVAILILQMAVLLGALAAAALRSGEGGTADAFVLAIALYLAGEQAVRLWRLHTGALAPSLLRHLVRPGARRLLEAAGS